MKIQKFIAHAGITSRRKAEDLIRDKKVIINGRVAQIGQRVDPTKDSVIVNGKKIKNLPEFIYILINKPVGYLSTTHDPQGRKTIIDILPPKLKKERLYPVGRLDYDSEGLMLLTNDGDYAYKLTHPSFEILKTYRVTVHKTPSEHDIDKLENGITLTKTLTTSPAHIDFISATKNTSTWDITIHEGKKRQVRRMFDAIHHPVKKLVRTKLGPYSLNDIKTGGYRVVEKVSIIDH